MDESEIGDGYENVAGAQIRDTLGEGQTIYEGTRIRVNVIDAVTKENCGQMIIDWEDVTVSDDKRTIEYTLPTEAEIEAEGIPGAGALLFRNLLLRKL